MRRVVLYTPAPAPALVIGRFRVAVAANGAQIPELPAPMSATGSRSCQIGVVGVAIIASQPMATALSSRAVATMYRGWIRSTCRPTMGASTPVRTAIGTVTTADSVGVRPATSCK